MRRTRIEAAERRSKRLPSSPKIPNPRSVPRATDPPTAAELRNKTRDEARHSLAIAAAGKDTEARVSTLAPPASASR